MKNRPMTLGEAIVMIDSLSAQRTQNPHERKVITAVMATALINGSRGRVRITD